VVVTWISAGLIAGSGGRFTCDSHKNRRFVLWWKVCLYSYKNRKGVKMKRLSLHIFTKMIMMMTRTIMNRVITTRIFIIVLKQCTTACIMKAPIAMQHLNFYFPMSKDPTSLFPLNTCPSNEKLKQERYAGLTPRSLPPSLAPSHLPSSLQTLPPSLSPPLLPIFFSSFVHSSPP